MRKSGIAERYVRVVQDMFEDSVTAIRSTLGVTYRFEAKVGLQQGSVLSHFLFAMVMGRLREEIRPEASRSMLFDDDIVLCSE